MNKNLKAQLETITKKVQEAEKVAAEQIRQILKTTDHVKKTQLKQIRDVIGKAKSMDRQDLIRQADQVKKTIESAASMGFDILLKKLAVATRKDIDSVSKKIATLQKRIEELEAKKTTPSK